MQKKIITIQDLSCTGRCSGTIALPVLSALGIETAFVPTTILSTHTGGFGTPYIADCTGHLPGILEHWKREKIGADGVYAGYLGSKDQMELVRRFCKELGNLPLYLDPVMGDQGKLYAGFDETYLEKMRELVKGATMIFPNLTETCALLSLPYREQFEEEEIRKMIKMLQTMGPDKVMITGISSEDGRFLGNCYGEEGRIEFFRNRKTKGHFHGTGDLFASCLIGAHLSGMEIKDSVKLAADFVCASIEKTLETPYEERDGVRFEQCLFMLTDAVRSDNKRQACG